MFKTWSAKIGNLRLKQGWRIKVYLLKEEGCFWQCILTWFKLQPITSHLTEHCEVEFPRGFLVHVRGVVVHVCLWSNIFNRWLTIFRTMQLKKSNIACRSGVRHGLLTLLTSTPMLLRIIIMVVWLMVPPSLSNPSKPFFNESTCKVDTVSIIEKLDGGTEFDDQTSLSHQIKIVFYKLLSVRDIFCTSILWYVTYFDVSSNQRLFTIIPRYLRMNMNVWWWRHDNYLL